MDRDIRHCGKLRGRGKGLHSANLTVAKADFDTSEMVTSSQYLQIFKGQISSIKSRNRAKWQLDLVVGRSLLLLEKRLLEHVYKPERLTRL